MPEPLSSRSQVLDHRGLVAGMFAELARGEVLAQATHQNPALRDLTGGEAVNAMVLTGLGGINPARSRVPRFFQPKPTYRLIAPRVAPAQRNDDARGRTLETRSDDGVTQRYRLLAATAAERLGLAPRLTPLARPSFHGEGRDHRDDEPAEHVGHSTQGSSREPRPDLNQVMRELLVAHPAGIPVRMKPRRGTSRAGKAFGPRVPEHRAPWQTTDGTPSLVADRAL
jgi:hypothetical protein